MMQRNGTRGKKWDFPFKMAQNDLTGKKHPDRRGTEFEQRNGTNQNHCTVEKNPRNTDNP